MYEVVSKKATIYEVNGKKFTEKDEADTYASLKNIQTFCEEVFYTGAGKAEIADIIFENREKLKQLL